MSNSFTSPPLLTDASRVVAGQTIRTTEVARLADASNYAFAVGGTSNVLSQTWDDSSFRQDWLLALLRCASGISHRSAHLTRLSRFEFSGLELGRWQMLRLSLRTFVVGGERHILADHITITASSQ
jgi:hypothetical protein